MYNPNPTAGGGSNICPICRTVIQPNMQVVSCPSCGGKYHLQCWQQNQGCASPACKATAAQAPRTPQPLTGQPVQPQQPMQPQYPQQQPGYPPAPGQPPYPQQYGQSPYQSQYGARPQQPTYAMANSANAGFWVRVGASFIDGVVYFVAFLVLMQLFGVSFTGIIQDVQKRTFMRQSSRAMPTSAPSQIPGQTTMPNPTMTPTPVSPLSPELTAKLNSMNWTARGLFILYDILLVTLVGATLGKMALGVKIVRSDESKIGFGRAVLRYICKYILSIPCGLTFWFVAFTEDKRGLHDMICDTRVVYTK